MDNQRFERFKTLFGAICFLFNLVVLIMGVMLVIIGIRLIGSGEIELVLEGIGKIININPYGVVFIFGCVLLIVSLKYSYKVYQEALRLETRSVRDFIRHH